MQPQLKNDLAEISVPEQYYQKHLFKSFSVSTYQGQISRGLRIGFYFSFQHSVQ